MRQESILYKNRFYNENLRNNIWKVLTKNYFQKFIKKSDNVLDLPCGYGEFINNISCNKKYALDINKDAKKFLHKNITFLHASATKIPLQKNSVDKIFISNFFEHITKQESILVVKECKRILKKNGQVIILQPNIRFCAKDYWRFFDHITPIDDRALEELFSLFGFKKIFSVLKFLPYTTQDSYNKNQFFILLSVRLYLLFPLLWSFFGKQSLLIFQKND